MSNSQFQVGNVVRSNVGVQGLVFGREYRVVEVHVQEFFMGNFVEYVLEHSGQRQRVVNGHLLLSSVS